MKRLTGRFASARPKRDQRKSVRRKLSLTLPTLRSRNSESVLVLDLSLAGMMIHTLTELTVGEVFQFDLPETGATEAIVVWKRQTLYGCEFISPISPEDGSAALRTASPNRRTT